MRVNSSVHPSQVKLARVFSSIILIGPPMNEKLVDLVAHLFPPEDARVALGLPLLVPKKPDRIARKLKMPLFDAMKPLNAMANRRVILRFAGGYSLLPLLPGMFEYMMMHDHGNSAWHREFIRLFADLFDTGYLKRYTGPSMPVVRYLPLNQSITDSRHAVGGDYLSQLVDRHEDMAILNKCQCRQAHEMLEEKCNRGGNSSDGCMWFGEFARWAISEGGGRRVSKEQMRAYMDRMHKKGMVFMAGNLSPASSNAVCACCDCCCHGLHLVNRFEGMSLVAQPLLKARVDEDACIHCGACLKACNTHAHAMENKRHLYEKEKCIGCGVCMDACKQHAISMTPNPRHKRAPASIPRLFVQLAPAYARLFLHAKMQ